MLPPRTADVALRRETTARLMLSSSSRQQEHLSQQLRQRDDLLLMSSLSASWQLPVQRQQQSTTTTTTMQTPPTNELSLPPLSSPSKGNIGNTGVNRPALDTLMVDEDVDVHPLAPPATLLSGRDEPSSAWAIPAPQRPAPVPTLTTKAATALKSTSQQQQRASSSDVHTMKHQRAPSGTHTLLRGQGQREFGSVQPKQSVAARRATVGAALPPPSQPALSMTTAPPSQRAEPLHPHHHHNDGDEDDDVSAAAASLRRQVMKTRIAALVSRVAPLAAVMTSAAAGVAAVAAVGGAGGDGRTGPPQSSTAAAAMELVAQGVLGVHNVDTLLRLFATTSTTSATAVGTCEFMSISLASMALDDSAYVAGGVAGGIAAMLDLHMSVMAPIKSSPRTLLCMSREYRIQLMEVLLAGGTSIVSAASLAEAMSPPEHTLRALAALQSPSLSLVLANTGLTDAALAAMVPTTAAAAAHHTTSITHPTEDVVQHEQDVTTTTTRIHAMLLHNNRLTTRCYVRPMYAPPPAIPAEHQPNTTMHGHETSAHHKTPHIEYAGGLVGLMAISPEIQALSLHNNPLLCNGTRDSGRGLAEAIVVQGRSESVAPPLHPLLPPRLGCVLPSSLRSLSLSNTGLGDEGVAEFARVAFPFLTSLAKLSLGSNRITDRGVVALHRCMTTANDGSAPQPDMYKQFNDALLWQSTGERGADGTAITANDNITAWLRPPVGARWVGTTRCYLQRLESLDMTKNLIGGDGLLWLTTLGIPCLTTT